MERSNFANILITTRLLPYFNDDNVAAMKSCIFSELKCQNEKEFLCKVLIMINSSLSNKSTAILKDKALEIADSQQLPLATFNIDKYNDNQSDDETRASIHQKQKTVCTVLKYTEDRYNDSLSNLNSYIIDLIGSFLTKQESISLGYLNKELYIETQKLSYLLQRCKDTNMKKPFLLDNYRLPSLLWSGSSAYNYNFPLHLSLTNYHDELTYSWNKMFKKDWFNRFFLRLDYLRCATVKLIPHIPINVLFNSKCNFYDSNESREYIEELSISGLCKHAGQERDEIGLEQFCEKFEKYKKLNGSRMRKIKCFRFGVAMGYDYKNTHIPRALKNIFLSCCGISQKIIIDFNINKLGIKNVNELEQIFHPKLKSFSFAGGNLAFDINDYDYDNIDKCELKSLRQMGGSLEEIEITRCLDETHPAGDNDQPTEELCCTLNFLDEFEIRRNIKEYIINWQSNFRHREASEVLLDKLFFYDCEKHPLLERVVLKINGLNRSVGVSSAMQYLVEHKEEFFVDKEIKEELKHLQSIDIEFEISCNINGMIVNPQFADILQVDMGIEVDDNNFVMNEIFEIESDQEVITINNVGQCIDTLKQNIIHWINKIEKNHSKNEKIHRRVVLTV